ncbi:MAG: hypothetical protein KDC52_19630 [Ignavibacteriae bacterium]|nr:hypothetical protein [Ignavibacteriota bacterium]MCB0747505.1 hypothetical protein [Ignavibacteriota bacterium]MCB0753693.1 hypothetical protein [Ignavibacteriota bacterium]
MKKLTFQIVFVILFVSLECFPQQHNYTFNKQGYYKDITYRPSKSDPNSTSQTWIFQNNPFVGMYFISGSDNQGNYEKYLTY